VRYPRQLRYGVGHCLKLFIARIHAVLTLCNSDMRSPSGSGGYPVPGAVSLRHAGAALLRAPNLPVNEPLADLWRQLWNDLRAPRPPKAALTAYTGEDDHIRVLQSGFQMHVPKPISPRKLAAVVVQLAYGAE
jgi:DNA-binding NarL/FixJ family response regulator